jgi:hypothetical protein
MNTSARSIQHYKRLAGIGSTYENWKKPDLLDESEALDPKKLRVSLGRMKIRNLANMLEEERIGGSLRLPQFETWRIKRLVTEAETSPAAQAAAQHHMAARKATTAAHETHSWNNPQQSARYHQHAAELHRRAAKHMAASGDARTAHTHDQWARHHEQWAAHHARALGGAHVTQHAPPAAPTKAPAKAPKKKAGLIGKLKQKLAGAGGIDWSKEAEKTAHAPKMPKPKAQKDPFPASMPSHEKHAMRAHGAAAGAHELETNPHVGSEHKAEAFKKASQEHLHAALSAFHAGDHQKALQHFNVAIHHMNKHAQHMSDAAAQGRQRERRAAPRGPRTTVGRVHV